MPKPKKALPSVQLQSYLDEPRDDGAVLTFTASTHHAVSTKEAAMRQYLVAWEAKWKRMASSGYVLSNCQSFSMEFFTGLQPKQFLVFFLTPQ